MLLMCWRLSASGRGDYLHSTPPVVRQSTCCRFSAAAELTSGKMMEGTSASAPGKVAPPAANMFPPLCFLGSAPAVCPPTWLQMQRKGN